MRLLPLRIVRRVVLRVMRRILRLLGMKALLPLSRRDSLRDPLQDARRDRCPSSRLLPGLAELRLLLVPRTASKCGIGLEGECGRCHANNHCCSNHSCLTLLGFGNQVAWKRQACRSVVT